MSYDAVTMLVADPRPENRERIAAMLAEMQRIFQCRTAVHVSDIPDGREAYDRFMVRDLWRRFDTSHVLVMQLDGYLLHPEAWRDEWLAYDYIGAPWPRAMLGRFGSRVGNGGFSLRSRRLCVAAAGVPYEPGNDDAFICGKARKHLVAEGMRFAPVEVARCFSIELPIEEGHPAVTFGFHDYGAPEFGAPPT